MSIRPRSQAHLTSRQIAADLANYERSDLNAVGGNQARNVINGEEGKRIKVYAFDIRNTSETQDSAVQWLAGQANDLPGSTALHTAPVKIVSGANWDWHFCPKPRFELADGKSLVLSNTNSGAVEVTVFYRKE